MLSTGADLLSLTNGRPLLALAALVLAAAGWIARRAFRSQARQGSRIGTLEKVLKSERTRRRQVEQCLREQGIELPYWPDDPAELHGITAQRRSYDPYHYEDPSPEGPPTTAAPLPPVPPFSDDERERLARHRR